MLKIFRRPSRNSSEDEKTDERNCGGATAAATKRHSLPPSSSSASLINSDCGLLDESFTAGPLDETFESRSRLSMNLDEIINDKTCLSYFVQYLETKNALSLIKFYLDSESFKTATKHQMRKFGKDFRQSEECLSRVSLDSDTISEDRYSLMSAGLTEIDENQSPVPELKTLCDLSMRKPLTDDEKSQIYAETNKRKLKASKSAMARINSMAEDDEKIEKKGFKSSSTIGTDAIRIYRKYFIANSQCYIDIPETIHSQLSLALCAQDDDSAVSWPLFNNAQQYILQKLDEEHLNDFLQSTYYCKYCVEVLTSPSLKLRDILHGEATLFYFMEYLEQEGQRDCLEFWLTAMNFRKHYEQVVLDDSGKKEAQNDAMILYEKYFSLQALCPLRISDGVRSNVEERICSDIVACHTCFDLPLQIIEKYIEQKYFSSFLKSSLFGNYLNELKSKVSDHKHWEANSSKRSRHRKTMSDCTNESTKNLRNDYISQHNTLLAMESKLPKLKPPSSDMQIDSRQLTNPDLLWHRNSTGQLTFGRVDSMGRYERDFDMHIVGEKWSLASGGNKLKNAVRKLVNLPEDKVQEEIAWQMAEMIVKDVTSVTLGDFTNKSPEST